MDYINGETVGILLFFIGAWGLVSRRNILKSILSIGIMQSAVILFYLSMDTSGKSAPPIMPLAVDPNVVIADPLPQALMITEIVIGAGVASASLVMFIHLFHKYGTTNWSTLRNAFLKHDSQTRKSR